MDKPYLTLVDPSTSSEHDQEFIPLPFYPWDERPLTVPLDADEVATAIHLAEGDLRAAAKLLCVPLYKVTRQVTAHPRLQRVLSEANALVVAKAASEYIRALDDANNDRRREWAASKIMASRAAASHPFSPAPVQPTSAASLSLLQTANGRTLTFRWRTDADEPGPIDGDNDRQ